jgi:hypothetical protein
VLLSRGVSLRGHLVCTVDAYLDFAQQIFKTRARRLHSFRAFFFWWKIMHLPDYVEPFVDTEPGRWRVTGAVIVTIVIALLSEGGGWPIGSLPLW